MSTWSYARRIFMCVNRIHILDFCPQNVQLLTISCLALQAAYINGGIFLKSTLNFLSNDKNSMSNDVIYRNGSPKSSLDA